MQDPGWLYQLDRLVQILMWNVTMFHLHQWKMQPEALQDEEDKDL